LVSKLVWTHTLEEKSFASAGDRYQLKSMRLNRRIILKWFLKTLGSNVWAGFKRLRTRACGRNL
jgi:hypothetical protein